MSDILDPQNDGFNIEKFKQVLHYIISKTGSSPTVGKTVLFKLLYFNDFNYYELNEEKMTGERYYHLDHGPAPVHFDDAIAALKAEKAIIEEIRPYYGKSQIKFRSLSEPDVRLLTAVEIKHIDDTLGRYGSMDASQISAISHEDIPWIVTENGCDLDYELVFYRSAKMSLRRYSDDD